MSIVGSAICKSRILPLVGQGLQRMQILVCQNQYKRSIVGSGIVFLGFFFASQENCVNQCIDVASKRERKKWRDRTGSEQLKLTQGQFLNRVLQIFRPYFSDVGIIGNEKAFGKWAKAWLVYQNFLTFLNDTYIEKIRSKRVWVQGILTTLLTCSIKVQCKIWKKNIFHWRKQGHKKWQ